MLCQDCRHYLDSKRLGDTAEEYSCPSCIGFAGRPREFPKDTKTEDEARKRKYYRTWPDSLFFPIVLVLALLIFVWSYFGLFSLALARQIF